MVVRDAQLSVKDVWNCGRPLHVKDLAPIGTRKPDDPRNQLILEFFRFVRVISNPDSSLLENVPGILLDGSRAVLDRGVGSVGSAYNVLGPIIVDAADYGAPTRRRRVLLIGFRSSVDPLSEIDIRAVEVPRVTTVFEAIHDLPSPRQAVLRSDGAVHCAAYLSVPKRGTTGNYARRARAMPPPGLASPDDSQNFRDRADHWV